MIKPEFDFNKGFSRLSDAPFSSGAKTTMVDDGLTAKTSKPQLPVALPAADFSGFKSNTHYSDRYAQWSPVKENSLQAANAPDAVWQSLSVHKRRNDSEF